MFGCRRYQGLIAASLYENLTDREHRALQNHLARCESCRSDAAALGKLVATLPDTQVGLDLDLAPALRARLRQGVGTTRPIPVGRWALAAAASFVLIAGVFFGVVKTAHAPGPGQAEMASSSVEAPVSPVRAELARADALVEARDFTQAYRLLENAVQTFSDDELAGEAQERLADLAFSDLAWYDKAYEAYETLAGQYSATYEANPRNIDRRNLLAEARKVNYASLYAYEAACQDRTDPLGRLQNVIAKFPSTYVASLAAADIGRLGAGEGDGTEDRLQAMIKVRDASRDPVVVAQLNLEIGHIYRDERNDFSTAREHYVKASENPMLARVAKDAILSLESGSSR